MSVMQTKLDYADEIAEWFLGLGEASSLQGDFEQGIKYTYVAATILQRQNRYLSSARAESNLRFVASNLAECRRLGLVKHVNKNDEREVCLHVMSEAVPAGGITAMVTRWMINDQSRIHSVALLEKQSPIPDGIIQAVTGSGGTIYIAKQGDSILQRAAWLRALAKEVANYTILHIGSSDVLCGAAFGANGGPPVLLVNYTAHTFWTGASIADSVINVRGSALEELWAAKYRGIPRYATVPIPLEKPRPFTSETAYLQLKHQAKRTLGLEEDSIVILTVGSFFKFLPTEGLDFVKACENILNQVPQAQLLAVGFKGDGDSRWTNASRRVGGRIKTLGVLSHSQLAEIHDATDIYIEGFPFGTTTSLLEAGIKRVSVVLAPAQCPPPYGTDGVALDDILERPGTVADFKTKVIDLCNSADERGIEADRICDAIMQHHTGPGWQQYLEDALRALPEEHCTYALVTPPRTPKVIHEYWATFMEKISFGYEETLEIAVSLALSGGLRPKLTSKVLQACRDFRSVRTLGSIPLPLLIFLCNFLLQMLPISSAHNTFRLFSFLCRPSLFTRMRSKLPPLFGGTEPARPMYGEYRKTNK
jgi:hypothetical protein